MGRQRVIVGDSETTGKVMPRKAVELAWLEIDDNLEVIDEVESLIDPQMHIGAGAIAVHGIYPADVADAPTIEEFWGSVRAGHFADDDRVILIGHNIQFDVPYFQPYVKGFADSVCTLRLAKVFLLDAEEHNLGALAVQYQLSRGKAHRALGDCMTTLNLLRLIQQIGGASIMDLYADARKPRACPDKLWQFGKNKGSTIGSTDKGYANWALKNMDSLDMDIRFTLEQMVAK